MSTLRARVLLACLQLLIGITFCQSTAPAASASSILLSTANLIRTPTNTYTPPLHTHRYSHLVARAGASLVVRLDSSISPPPLSPAAAEKATAPSPLRPVNKPIPQTKHTWRAHHTQVDTNDESTSVRPVHRQLDSIVATSSTGTKNNCIDTFDPPIIETILADDSELLVAFWPPANEARQCQKILYFYVGDGIRDPAAIARATLEPNPSLGGAYSVRLTQLTNGQTYIVRVTVASALTTSFAEMHATPARAPDAPEVTSTITGDRTAVLSFTSPANDGGSPITGYTVFNLLTGDLSGSGVTSPILLTSLVNGQPYMFVVVAANAMGSGPPSLPTPTVTPMPTPLTPFLYAAQTGSTDGFDKKIRVYFFPPTDNGAKISSYKIAARAFLDGSDQGHFVTTIVSSSPGDCTGLIPGLIYNLSITAIGSNAAESDISNQVRVAVGVDQASWSWFPDQDWNGRCVNATIKTVRNINNTATTNATQNATNTNSYSAMIDIDFQLLSTLTPTSSLLVNCSDLATPTVCNTSSSSGLGIPAASSSTGSMGNDSTPLSPSGGSSSSGTLGSTSDPDPASSASPWASTGGDAPSSLTGDSSTNSPDSSTGIDGSTAASTATNESGRPALTSTGAAPYSSTAPSSSASSSPSVGDSSTGSLYDLSSTLDFRFSSPNPTPADNLSSTGAGSTLQPSSTADQRIIISSSSTGASASSLPPVGSVRLSIKMEFDSSVNVFDRPTSWWTNITEQWANIYQVEPARVQIKSVDGAPTTLSAQKVTLLGHQPSQPHFRRRLFAATKQSVTLVVDILPPLSSNDNLSSAAVANSLSQGLQDPTSTVAQTIASVGGTVAEVTAVHNDSTTTPSDDTDAWSDSRYLILGLGVGGGCILAIGATMGMCMWHRYRSSIPTKVEYGLPAPIPAPIAPGPVRPQNHPTSIQMAERRVDPEDYARRGRPQQAGIHAHQPEFVLDSPFQKAMAQLRRMHPSSCIDGEFATPPLGHRRYGSNPVDPLRSGVRGWGATAAGRIGRTSAGGSHDLTIKGGRNNTSEQRPHQHEYGANRNAEVEIDMSDDFQPNTAYKFYDDPVDSPLPVDDAPPSFYPIMLPIDDGSSIPDGSVEDDPHAFMRFQPQPLHFAMQPIDTDDAPTQASTSDTGAGGYSLPQFEPAADVSDAHQQQQQHQVNFHHAMPSNSLFRQAHDPAQHATPSLSPSCDGSTSPLTPDHNSLGANPVVVPPFNFAPIRAVLHTDSTSTLSYSPSPLACVTCVRPDPMRSLPPSLVSCDSDHDDERVSLPTDHPMFTPQSSAEYDRRGHTHDNTNQTNNTATEGNMKQPYDKPIKHNQPHYETYDHKGRHDAVHEVTTGKESTDPVVLSMQPFSMPI